MLSDIQNETSLLTAKLEQLVIELREKLQAKQSTSPILEELITEANQVLSRYLSTPREPLSSSQPPVLTGTEPSSKEFNAALENLRRDLTTLFRSLEDVETVVLGNFNYFISQSERVRAQLKSVSSKVGDYSLYASNSRDSSTHFSDSFTNLDRIEVSRKFYTLPSCDVDQEEGLVSLPISRSSQTPLKITKPPLIESQSNGVPGNNQQVGELRNDNLLSILDGNPDTWFEYERVVLPSQDDATPLLLTMRFDLGKQEVVNYIRINPNNFGTRTPVEIVSLGTSLDGSTEISVRDEVVLPDQDNSPLLLAPSTSKFAGEGVFSFSPRKAQYIHVSLKQTTPYPIRTLTGYRFRYAIGIRGFEVESVRYEPEGEVISSQYSLPSIVKVAVVSNQNPDSATPSNLASVSHFIAEGDSGTWKEIRPLQGSGSSGVVNEIPEIITFNEPVDSIRWRAVLRRNTDEWRENSTAMLKPRSKFTTELHEVPASAPFSIELQNDPVSDTVSVCDPHFGSRGDLGIRYVVGEANEAAHNYYLPWREIPMDYGREQEEDTVYLVPISPIRVFVNGDEWSQADLSTSGPTDTVFTVDHIRGVVKFGDGVHGRTPDQGSLITIEFTPERLLTTPVEDGYLAQLAFPTNGDQKLVSIRRFDPDRSHVVVLARGARHFRLPHTHLVDGSVFFKPHRDLDAVSPFDLDQEKTFVDGSVELLETGDWSLDYETGHLYSKRPTPLNTDISISYHYTPVVTLPEEAWYFPGDGVRDRVIVKKSAWGTTAISGEAVLPSVNQFQLRHFNIEPGSLIFTNSTTFSREVPFQDGRREVLGLEDAREVVPAVSTWNILGSNVYSFQTSLIPADTGNHPISFTNTDVFTTQVSITPANPGEYQIDEVNRLVTTYQPNLSFNPGYMSYMYRDASQHLTGTYSVDYQHGTVFTHTATASVDPGYTSYRYADLDISYPIARILPQSDYSVNGKVVSIEDREILRRAGVPRITARPGDSTYQVLYRYITGGNGLLTELEPFFTPIIRDYTLKVVTADNLVVSSLLSTSS